MVISWEASFKEEPVSTIPWVEMPGSRSAIDTHLDFRKRSPLNAEKDVHDLIV